MQLPPDDTDTPGAELAPIDKAAHSRKSPPDCHGEDYGIAWAAWLQTHMTQYKTWFEVYLILPDGERVKRVVSSKRGGAPRKWYFTRRSLEGIRSLCFEQYCRHLRSVETPLRDLQKRFRKGQEDKARWRKMAQGTRKSRRRDVKRAARYYGKEPEQVSQADLWAYRQRGQVDLATQQ